MLAMTKQWSVCLQTITRLTPQPVLYAYAQNLHELLVSEDTLSCMPSITIFYHYYSLVAVLSSRRERVRI